MDQDRAYLLLAKSMAGEATPEEREELEWAFLAHPELRLLAESLPGLRQLPPKGLTGGEEQAMLDRGLERIRRRGEVTPLRSLPVVRLLTEIDVEAESQRPAGGRVVEARRLMPRVARWGVAAACLAVVTGAALLFRHRTSSERSAPVAILTAERGTRKFARLPDGTQLWLNAGSRIVLAQGFSHDQRELTLEGEAYFDVKHDEQRPFIIHTGAVDVRVLGTTLNVRAYPGEPSMEATLIEGKAEIGLAGNPQSAIPLHPNEKVIIPNDAAVSHVDAADNSRDAALPLNYVRTPIVPDRTDGTIAETSWTKNKLVFRNETLGSMSTRLERWYNVTIVFDDKRYQQDTISGTFPNMPIGDVMHALRITSGFNFKIYKDTVHIW